MVGVFGARMVVQFSFKDLGLSAKVSGTVFGQSRLDCELSSSGSVLSSCVCFGQFREELSDC